MFTPWSIDFRYDLYSSVCISLTIKTITTMVVIWKYEQEEEQRKEFADINSAFRFQASLLKKKKGLEYARYE